jgi:probable H4MPT-linked C1 transfer pathway protein
MNTLALDIGGANLKAAHSDGSHGSAPFPLWEQPNDLLDELKALAGGMTSFDRLAVTMTGELCDCFETKREGVAHILRCAQQLAGDRDVAIWSTEGKFVSLSEARQKPMRVAAANWHALATWIAQTYPVGVTLLLDTGSTTTDVIKCTGGSAKITGFTDTQRLLSGELVYLGATRTPLAVLGPTVDLGGKAYPLMNELFAVTEDIYVLTGDRPEQAAHIDTVDGRPMTKRYAATRVVRMVGGDLEMMTLDEATQLARSFSDVVTHRIAEAIRKVMYMPKAPRTTRVVLSGSGAFVGEKAAKVAEPGTPIEHLAQQIGEAGSHAAAAHAVLQLRDAAS